MTTKSFDISKHLVWEAYKRVKINKGAAGVDAISISDFEENLTGNLYKIWNRMSSGSYFPPAIRLLEIPKGNGDKRPLGIPTVADRIAQMVAKMTLEPLLDSHFHEDSYGFRPNKSAYQAIGKARKRCWKYAWAIDLDIKQFFDNIDHALLMRAVIKHTQCKWLLLYIKRWLKAPIQMVDGTLRNRRIGTPQGDVLSPLLANLFLHYAFDCWMKRYHPTIRFERYADDIVIHCQTQEEAIQLRQLIDERFRHCKLELNIDKTQVMYCKDDNRQ